MGGRQDDDAQDDVEESQGCNGQAVPPYHCEDERDFLHNLVNFTGATKRSASESLSRTTLQALAKERGFTEANVSQNAEKADLVKTDQDAAELA